MSLFKKRPLSLILFIMLCGFSAFVGFEPLMCAVAVCIGAVAIPIIQSRRRLLKEHTLFATLCAVAFIISVFLAMLWQALFFPHDYYDRDVIIVGTIEEVNDDGLQLVIKSERIDGDSKKYKLVIYLEDANEDEEDAENTSEREHDDYCIGDRLVVVARISKLTEDGRSIYDNSYLLSKGICAEAEQIGAVSVTHTNDKTLLSYISAMRSAVSRRLIEVSDERAGGFLCALITGDKDLLDSNTALNFSRIGISHILALSGMHIAILAMGLSKLLGLFCLNKKIKTVVIMLFTIFYMAFTGFSPSVTRAGIMLIVPSLLFLLSRSKDSITSLFVAVSLIVIVEPTSIFSLSLWLSALATLGIIFYSDLVSKRSEEEKKAKKKQSLIHRITRKLLDGIYSSVFAIAATTIITMLSFSSISLLGPISTILFSFATEIFIYLGLIAAAIGSIIPMNGILVWFSESIMRLAEKLSSLRIACISSDYTSVTLLSAILVIIFFAYAVFGSGKAKRTFPLLCLTLLLSVYAAAGIHYVNDSKTEKTVYTANEGMDIILVRSEGDGAMIVNGADEYYAYELLSLASEERMTYLDSLIFPEYANDTVIFTEATISKIKTQYVFLPMPRSTAEMTLAEQMSELISNYGASLKFYTRENALQIGAYTYTLIANADVTDGSYSESIFTLIGNNSVMTYSAPSAYDSSDTRLTAVLGHTDNLILGSSSYDGTPNLGFVLSNFNNIYLGRSYFVPDDVAEMYKRCGINVKRCEKVVLYEK